MYIYSRRSDKDLFLMSATNSVADAYELLGLYHEYCHDATKWDFEEYYLSNVHTQPYHFRNIGEKIVKRSLLEKGIYVTRKELRLLSTTYQRIPVITSSRMGVIFSELMNWICNYEVPKSVILKWDQEFSPEDFLYFQYTFVYRYVHVKDYASSFKKAKAFGAVLEEWENSIIFHQKTT